MRQTAEDVAHAVLELARSGLFDRDWYRTRYGEVAGPDGDLLVHFCNTGWTEGRWPNFHFRTDDYLTANQDVAQAGINPLLHYHRIGEQEGRCPAPHFEVAWYRAHYGIEAGSCLSHFLAHRRSRPTSPNDWFDAGWYAAAHPEVAASGWDAFEYYVEVGSAGRHACSRDEHLIGGSGLFDGTYYRLATGLDVDDERDLIRHYCKTGWREGRNPNPVFETTTYLRRNDDVSEAGINPLLHFIEHGEEENRVVSDAFDALQYREVYEPPATRSALRMHLERMAAARRLARQLDAGHRAASTSTDRALEEIAAVIAASHLFDENHYLIGYPDVRLSGLDPLVHFCRYGAEEGRRPNPYFDTDWYRLTYMPGGKSAGNPLLHYILHGEAAGLRPIVYFETEWYRDRYGINASVSPLLHYLRHRRRQMFSPHPLFDVAFYARGAGAAAGPNRDLFAHYLRVGIARPIDPGPGFDARAYRDRCMGTARTPFRAPPGAEVHERIRRERLNPLVHYLLGQSGKDQARPALAHHGETVD